MKLMGARYTTSLHNHPRNDRWEKLDYSDREVKDSIYYVITSGYASQKTITRILQTAEPTTNFYEACLHEFARVEDIIEAIQKFNTQPLTNYNREVVNNLTNSILFGINFSEYDKREEFAKYLKNNYNVDIDIMPEELIKQMLQIEDMETNA
jgi:hypothetical protein